MADSSVSRRSKRQRWWLVVGLLMLVAAGIRVWRFAARAGAPNARRGEMYQRTLENVRSICVQPKPGVESYCRDQALLLLEYPECDPACVALARKVRGEPTR